MQVLVVAIASLPLLTHGHDMAARPVQQAAVEPAPALPLSEYRYIFTNYRTETALYVLELLAKGPFRVVASRIAVPPEEANLVLELKPFGGPWQLGGG